jgi:hypothetical protein
MTSVLIKDESTTAKNNHTWTLEFLDETIPAREFLRRRIYEEVLEYNSKTVDKNLQKYNGLVQPTSLEQTLNGSSPKTARKLDWEAQYQTAVEAFFRNGFVMLWNDRQVEDLDQMLELREGCEATFLKLVPLVGG